VADYCQRRSHLAASQVKDWAWSRKQENPLLKATHIAGEITQRISLDAQKPEPHFPRMLNGQSYAPRHVLDTTRKALKDLS
jgi:hypothetical protein